MNLTYADLIRRLVDLERLAEPPLPGERGGCVSSHDRRSQYDAAADAYVDWDANSDGRDFIRREGEWIVAFEEEGPGVIWRAWSAEPWMGRVQIFIDGAPDPVVDTPFRHFFERFNDVPFPGNFTSLAPVLSRGFNRFIPIPFNRSCKIRLGPEWGVFYHFTYTKFPEGTTVPSFDGTYDVPTAIALATADRTLADRGWRPPAIPDRTVDRIEVTVPPGATLPLHTITGNRAITAIRAEVDLPAAPADRDVLRELTLSIRWDGEESPSVWSPIGDFFGSAPRTSYFRTLPVGATGGGFYSHWFMPFAETAELTVGNDGTEPRTLRFAIHHTPLERPATDLLRFHAKWHRNAFLDKPASEGREIDWPMLLTEGRGRFCGVFLHIWNHWDEPAEEAENWWERTLDWWWGEGDEKFFVDGERFPSTFGTGSEDYFGYAVATLPPYPIFDSPYAAQPYIELDANGNTTACRFHIADDVPFQESFGAYIERYKGDTWGGGNESLYAAVAYWYQSPGGSDPYGPVPVAERVGYYR